MSPKVENERAPRACWAVICADFEEMIQKRGGKCILLKENDDGMK